LREACPAGCPGTHNLVRHRDAALRCIWTVTLKNASSKPSRNIPGPDVYTFVRDRPNRTTTDPSLRERAKLTAAPISGMTVSSMTRYYPEPTAYERARATRTGSVRLGLTDFGRKRNTGAPATGALFLLAKDG